MATVTGLTAERMLEIEAQSIVDGDVVAGDLILQRFDGTPINAGSVEGPAGPAGPAASIPERLAPQAGLVTHILNADTAEESGWYGCDDGASNVPAGIGPCLLEVISWDIAGNVVLQFAHDMDSHASWRRYKWGSWAAWVQIWPVTPSIPIGTTLPASPANGDEAILVDSLTSPTYSWRFKYSTGVTADANKWIFIGGAPIVVSGNSSKTSAAFSALASVIVPRAGIYAIDAVGRVRLTGGTIPDPLMRVVVAGTQVYSHNDGGLQLNQAVYAARTGSIAASSVISIDYAGNASDGVWGAAKLAVTPVRVA